MPLYKLTLLINYASVSARGARSVRAAGWSESVYTADDPFGVGAAKASALYIARSALLSTECTIVGIRSSVKNPRNSAKVLRLAFAGTSGLKCDLPTLSAYGAVVGSTGNRLKIVLRGLPDDYCVQGEFSGSPDITPAWNRYCAALAGYQQSVRDVAATQADILVIDANGNVRTQQPMTGIQANDKVRVLRAITAQKKSPSGLYVVDAVTDEKHFKLLNWPQVACTGGTVRFNATTLATYPVAGYNLIEPTTKKCGKPFFSYRGRARKSA